MTGSGDAQTAQLKEHAAAAAQAVAAHAAAVEAAVAAHDAAIAALGMAVWVGGEPTFTDRFSQDPQWVSGALGGAKLAKAREMLAELRMQHPGALVVRTVGRQYPEEERPRWSLGLWRRRDGVGVWSGPNDPLAGGQASAAGAARGLREALAGRLRARGFSVGTFDVADDLPLRLAFSKGEPATVAASSSGRFARSASGRYSAVPDAAASPFSRHSIHAGKIPDSGARDELAAGGVFLVCFGVTDDAGEGADLGGLSSLAPGLFGDAPRVVRCELPAMPDVAAFAGLLEDLAGACGEVRIRGLVLTGFPPPVDGSIAFDTLTPDPAVVEVNMAPCAGVEDFLRGNRAIFAAAGASGIEPYRLYYNGDVADSGGGGQITIGGPSAAESPFFRWPQALPRLVCYLSRHPSLSYLFAVDSVGASSQSPRADETVRESFEDLSLALGVLGRSSAASPEELWAGLAPFLCDRFGSGHRSEINIEKLWNPWLAGRGKLGLVEFRAFRMARSPERAAALAALLRAMVARLAVGGDPGGLVDWGAELHDRWALPSELRRDLREVFADLNAAGVGLGAALQSELLDDRRRLIGRAKLGVAPDAIELTVLRAVEFWPLVGDLSKQSGPSRLIDPSTVRVEVALRCADPRRLERVSLELDGYAVPLRTAGTGAQPEVLTGIRYRSFMPRIGLHPGIPARGTLSFTVRVGDIGAAHRITLHPWKTPGGGYDGLPRDLAEATRRRLERFAAEETFVSPAQPKPAPRQAVTPWCFDTRWLGPDGLASGA
jgi:uncharacterized protein (DUF2126 family)